MNNTKEKATLSIIWSFFEKISSFSISFVISIILARLLDPDQYGIIALILVFITFADIFVMNGFGNAVIQKKDADDIDFSSVFYFNTGFGIFLYFILFFVAPLIEVYYDIQGLTELIRVMALTVVFGGIVSIQQSYIYKKLEFKKNFYSTISGTLVSGVIGIAMAYWGFGVWALVTQYVSRSIVNVSVLSIVSGFKPKLCYSHERMKGIISLGWKFLFAAFIQVLSKEIRTLVIGKKYSADDLAYVNRGQQFPTLLVTAINTSISSVMLPLMSDYQDNTSQIKAIQRRFVQVSSYILFPLLFGMAATARSLVSILLTEKWLPCVYFMIIYCAIYLLQPIQSSQLEAIKALGKGKILIILQIGKTLISLGTLCIAVFVYNSVNAIVLGSLFVEIACTLITCPIGKRLYGYRYREQIADILPPLFMSAGMYGLLLLISQINMADYLTLLIQIVVGVVSFLTVSIILKIKPFIYMKDLLSGMLFREKKKGE